jgi:hypothetical protein
MSELILKPNLTGGGRQKKRKNRKMLMLNGAPQIIIEIFSRKHKKLFISITFLFYFLFYIFNKYTECIV